MFKNIIILFLLCAYAICEVKAPEGIAVHEIAMSATYVKSVLEYWTPERMASAQPWQFSKMPEIPEDVYQQDPPKFPPIQLPPMPKPPIQRPPQRPPGGGGDRPTGTQYVPENKYEEMPYKLTGKVFFVQDGKNYVCSASSAGNNAVLTAGHCVSNGKGVYHTVSFFIQKTL